MCDCLLLLWLLLLLPLLLEVLGRAGLLLLLQPLLLAVLGVVPACVGYLLPVTSSRVCCARYCLVATAVLLLII